MDFVLQESVINTKILINYFKEICNDFSSPYKEENIWVNRRKAEWIKKIFSFLMQLKMLIKEGKCHAKTFKIEVMKITNLNMLHLEIFWYLEVVQLISLQEIIDYHEENNNKEVINYISQQIFERILEYDTKNSLVRKEMLIICLKTIFNVFKNNSRSISSDTLLHHITSNLNLPFYKESICDISSKTIDFSNLINLLKESEYDFYAIKLFCIHIVNHFLEGSPQSLKVIFKMQENFKNNFKTSNYFILFKDISKHCDLNDLQDVLKKQIFEKFEYTNWENMFPFISCLGIHYENGWSSLKTISNLCIKESIKNNNEKLLASGFLIARQSCFEKNNNLFPNYIHWFSSNFSSESKRPLNSKQACSFFFNFLTELLPYDAPYYPKVHINRCPWVPMDCQAFLTDYVTLVKTHLQDLNMSIELGIFENTSNKNSAAFDVENVIENFKKSNEIMPSVFQASMFHKEYFEKKFLIELLSKFEGKKSHRHKVIQKLHSMGKIPSSLFKNYKKLEKEK